MTQHTNKSSLAALNQIPSVQQDTPEAVEARIVAPDTFNYDLIAKYPRSNRRVGLMVSRFGLHTHDPAFNTDPNCHSIYISPHGLEFRSDDSYGEGDLLKILVNIPDYWTRKQRHVTYSRIDTPSHFKVLAKVLRCEESSKRGRKKIITVQTLIMDATDEKVLKQYLEED